MIESLIFETPNDIPRATPLSIDFERFKRERDLRFLVSPEFSKYDIYEKS